MRRLITLLLLPIAPVAFAAESYDACAGFIDTVPATITTQGTWCLRKDLVTSMTSGAAITISANNVTIDCDGFKLGGLAAGPNSQADGILAGDRLNATVRNCAIRGYRTGVELIGPSGGGHLVEDNRIDQSLFAGIRVEGNGNLIQRNRVFDTGSAGGSMGIYGHADIRDNIVDGMVGLFNLGIVAYGAGAEIRGNRIRNLSPENHAFAIELSGQEQSVLDNRIMGRASGTTDGIGIYGAVEGGAFCRDNLITSMQVGISGCDDNGGNVVH